MVLADTSIWIEHLRTNLPPMETLLRDGSVVMHPFVAAELALGCLRDRARFLAQLDGLLQVEVAQTSEIRSMIELRTLFGKGIGLLDAHLVASCLLTPGTRLWTRDAGLRRAAEALGLAADLP